MHPTAAYGALGAGISYLSTDGIPSYDNSGGRLDTTLSVSDLAFALSYGRTIASVDTGISVKFIQETLADTSAVAYAADAGILYRLPTGGKGTFMGKELKIAAVVQNIGPGVTFIEKQDPLPVNYKVGLAHNFLGETLTLSLDAAFPPDGDSSVSAGADYRIKEWVSLRAGYKHLSDRPSGDIQPGVMGGIGIGNESVSVDYAFVPYASFGSTHRIGLNYRFGRVLRQTMLRENLDRHFSRAERAMIKNDLVTAFRELNNVLLVDPINAKAREYLAGIQKRVNDIKVENYLGQVRAYLEADKLVEAKELIDNLLTLFPEHREAKEFQIRIQSVFTEQKAGRAESIFNQGMEFYEMKQFQDAALLWEKVLMVSPEHAKAREYLALARQELKAISENARRQEKEQKKKKAQQLLADGQRYMKERQWEKARRSFEESQKLDPASEGLEKALAELAARQSEDCFSRGQKHYDAKNLQGAVQQWEEAARLAPSSEKISEALAKAKGELKEANRNKADDYNRQALKEYDSGAIRKAVELWEKAAALDPDNTKIRNSLNRAKDELDKKK
ncbi:MAG: hypothetical protein A2293_01390 [Elusimicrobia bacterium RIFOXYB2_FULL_49_7]|nr:MAG: hypothetical protein A2293_01390 [Elusimicrobia bacterium RIFOXYB2_FULL_49_7]